MASEILRPGQNAQLQILRQEDVRVRLSVTGAAPLRLVGVLLDEAGQPAGPAPLLTWRTHTENVQINLSKGETISAILHTAAVQDPIQSIMFIAAPYDREYFLPAERLFTAIASDGAEPMAIEDIAPDNIMRAIALCEFYRHPSVGVKVRARSEWRHRELTTLLERLGITGKTLVEQNLYPLPNARHADSERNSLNDIIQKNKLSAAAPTGAPVAEPKATELPKDIPDAEAITPHAQPTIIHLADPGAQHRFISSNDAKFGEVKLNFSWHQRLATRAAVKLDLGCFYELQNGHKGQLEGLSDKHGSLSAPPFISLSGEMHQTGTLCEESILMNGDAWGQIRRVLFYAMIHEGPIQWDALDCAIRLTMVDQSQVQAELLGDNKTCPVAALLYLENRSDQLRVTYPGKYFESHYAMDGAFDFRLRWQNESAHPRDAAADHEWVPPAPLGFWRKWFGILFGTTTYNNAEDLMMACVVAATLVMVADGRVNQQERKNAVDELMRLPVGKMFAEYEVREGMEKVLRDLKQNRAASEQLAMRLLGAFRGSQDAKMIVQAMRRCAMVDGQVNIQEERMVERLTRYLKMHHSPAVRDAA